MLKRKRHGHSLSRTLGRRLERLGSSAVDEGLGAFMGKHKKAAPSPPAKPPTDFRP